MRRNLDKRKLLLIGFFLALGTWFIVPIYLVVQTSFLSAFAFVDPLTALRHASLNTWRLLPWLQFMKWFKNSLVVCISVSVLMTLMSILAGHGFAHFDFRFKEQVFWLFLLAMTIPGTILFLPRYLIVQSLGLLDSYLALIVPLILSPAMVFLSRQYLVGLGVDLLDAARIDGASEMEIVRHIIFPLSKPLLVFLVITGFSIGWGDFMWQYLVTRRAEIQTMTVGLGLYTIGLGTGVEAGEQLFSVLSRGITKESLGAAIAVLQSLPIFLLFAFGQKYFIEGLRIGVAE